MKTFIRTTIAIATMAISASAFAQYPTLPSLYADAAQGGLNFIEFEVTAKINRECKGYATLSRDGVILKQVPASNEYLVKCYYYDYSTEEGASSVTEYGFPNIRFFQNNKSSPATVEGMYTVEIPAGFFFVEGEPCPAITKKIEVYSNGEDERNAMIDPPGESRIEEASKFVITFEEGTEVEYIDNSGMVKESYVYSIALSDTENADGTKVSDVKIDKNIVTLTFDPPIRNIGTAFLEIKSGALKLTKDGETSTWSGSFRYLITGPAIKGDYTISPAAGEYTTIESFTIPGASDNSQAYFSIDLPADANLSFVLRSPATLVPVAEDGSYNPGDYVAQFFAAKATGDNGTLYLTPTKPQEKTTPSSLIMSPGRYMLCVPSGCCYINGVENEAMNFGPYTFNAPLVDNYTAIPSPDQPVKELKDIVLEFDNPKASLVWHMGTFVPVTSGPKEYSVRPTIEGNKLIFNLPTAITEGGEWTISVPPAVLYVDGVNSPLEVKYNIEEETVAVEAIEVERPAGTIYSIDGRPAGNSVERLAPGIYIHNGHKIIIRGQ